jgi:flavin-dependent dehydrogenase
MQKEKAVLVAGGGLAGLISSILLARKGIEVTILEKKSYPFHRVCGEYISNEVVPFLKSNNLFPSAFHPTAISRFQLTAVNGKSAILPLDLGGFGISRFSFDHFLFQEAQKSGVAIIQNEEVLSIDFRDNQFAVSVADRLLAADVVLCAFGKRSRLDVEWKRRFTTRRSPYVGVKHHLKTNHPADLIALHNFEGGYCGISNVEDGKSNLCYLVHRDKVREAGSIANLEEKVLKKNPWLKSIFNDSEFIFDKPETINEITFETKEPVFNHMLMVGDAAGMITPLCGNGMAMAIRSGKMVADLTVEFCQNKMKRSDLEKQYAFQWNKTFSNQLWFGRQVQRLFGNEVASNLAIQLAVKTKWIAQTIIRNTHGTPF